MPRSAARFTKASNSAARGHTNLAVTTTYLRRLEGEEDSGWRKVAALLQR